MSKVIPPQYVSYTKTWHNTPYEAISTSRAELSMAGKNVLITGGGTGIGKGTAIAFAQAGAKSISILGRRLDRLQTSQEAIEHAATSGDTRVIYEVADMTVPEQVEKAFETIVGQIGKIDVLVNNAGAICSPGPAAIAPMSHLMRVLETNVLTTFNAAQTFSKHAGPSPILVNITACLIHIKPMPMMGLYAAAKAAQTRMIDFIAAENPELHAVHLHPGMVTTEIGGPGSDVKGPDEVELPAQTAVWLASSEAAFLKGKLVWANWDMEELKAKAAEIQGSRLLTIGLEGVAM